MHCNHMQLFPFTALLRQWKKFGKFGIFISCFMLPMLSMKNEDLADTEEIFKALDDSGSNEFANAMEKTFETDLFKQRMRGNLDDAFKYGFL